MTEMTDVEIHEAATEAAQTPPTKVPDAEGLPTDVRDGVAGEDDPAIDQQHPTEDNR